MDFLAKPFGVVMSFLFENLAFGNYGLAMILFTIFVRLLLFPLTLKQQKSMVMTQRIQPELEELRKSYGNDSQGLMEAQQKLYAKYNVNPMAGCLPMLIQLPIFLVVYRIISEPLIYISKLSADTVSALQKLFTDKLGSGYVQIELNSLLHGNAEAIAKAAESGIGVTSESFFDMTFLKIFDLGVAPWQCISQKEWQYWPLLLIPVVMLATQYIMQKISQPNKKKDKKNEDPTMRSMNLMMKLMPIMTFVIAFMAPAGLGFYWTIGNLLSMLQTVVINKFFIKKEED